MATLAGCNALGNLGNLGSLVASTATSAPTATPAPEPGVARKKQATPTPRPSDLVTQASPTPTPRWTEDPYTPKPATPTPTPFPCEAWDGSKPTLRGEIVTLPNGAGKGAVHHTACWGEYTITPNMGSPYKVVLNGDKKDYPLDDFPMFEEGWMGIMAYGMVDDQPYVLVRHSAYAGNAQPDFKEALFRRTAVRGNQLIYELVKVSPLAAVDYYSVGGDNKIPHVSYNGFLRHLPGHPKTIAGDVASASYDKVLLTPNTEARWGAGEVDFKCAPPDEKNEDIVLRKIAVGHRYVSFLRFRKLDIGASNEEGIITYHHGAWILAKDGTWSKTKIFGPPSSAAREAWTGYGLGMPVWDEQLGGFVTTAVRATAFIPAHSYTDSQGYQWAPDFYALEKLDASFRIVTEDEIAASLEPIVGGCRAAN